MSEPSGSTVRNGQLHTYNAQGGFGESLAEKTLQVWCLG
jgi:hypothetical protein